MEMTSDMGQEHPASILRRRGFPAMSRRGLHPARGGRLVESGGVAAMKGALALDLDGDAQWLFPRFGVS